MESLIAATILSLLHICVLVFSDAEIGMRWGYSAPGILAFVCMLGGFSLAGVIAENSAFPWIFFIFFGLVFSVVFFCALFFVGCLASGNGI